MFRKRMNNESKKPFYITTTLPYVNAELHMGHALEFIRADAIARYKELMGFDVFFNSGTDEHGSKIYKKAEEEGKEVKQFVDENVKKFYESVKIFGLKDGVHFIRTTDDAHIKAAEAFWKTVDSNGYIYKKNYQTKYCIGCESEKTESELVDGKCPEHGTIPELIDEENYFFKYSHFTKPLLDFYEKNPQFVVPEFRFNEMKAFVERGLEDISISRRKEKMPWGIPVPGDDAHVMYVWFDALTSYIATLGWPDEEGEFKKYWVGGTPTQYCGKDNTRFQSVLWQAMLMAAGLPNSHQIIVNGFIVADGGVKMSKTIGNVVNPRDIARDYSTEALRFFLLAEVANFEDSPFTASRFRDAYNSKLANGLGNLTSRIMKMAVTNLTEWPEIPLTSIPDEWKERMEAFDIKGAMDIIFRHVGELDLIIQSKEPFKMVKIEKEKALAIMSDLVVRLYTIARMLSPFMPETSKQMKEIIKSRNMPGPLFLRKE